jgi:hypothetical protein
MTVGRRRISAGKGRTQDMTTVSSHAAKSLVHVNA